MNPGGDDMLEPPPEPHRTYFYPFYTILYRISDLPNNLSENKLHFIAMKLLWFLRYNDTDRLFNYLEVLFDMTVDNDYYNNIRNYLQLDLIPTTSNDMSIQGDDNVGFGGSKKSKSKRRSKRKSKRRTRK